MYRRYRATNGTHSALDEEARLGYLVCIVSSVRQELQTRLTLEFKTRKPGNWRGSSTDFQSTKNRIPPFSINHHRLVSTVFQLCPDYTRFHETSHNRP